METAATIAADLCQQMADTGMPNVGNYVDGIEGPWGPVGQIKNVELMRLYFTQPYGVDYLKQPAWTADTTPGNTTGKPHCYATAAEILGIEFLVKGGMVLDDIIAQISVNPTLVLDELYPPGDLLADALHACSDVGWPQSNDPLNVFNIKG